MTFADSNVVYLNVYRLRDSDLGFYHTGIVFLGVEYTYCQVGLKSQTLLVHWPRLFQFCSGHWNQFPPPRRLLLGRVPRLHKARDLGHCEEEVLEDAPRLRIKKSLDRQFKSTYLKPWINDVSEMKKKGFSASDYHVMNNCCNNFTQEVARKLDLLER